MARKAKKDSVILFSTVTPEESGVMRRDCTAAQAFAVEMLVNWLDSNPSDYRTSISSAHQKRHQKRFAQAVAFFLYEAKIFKKATGG